MRRKDHPELDKGGGADVREGVVGAARSGRGLAWRRWRGRHRFLTAGQRRGGEEQRGEDREQNTSRGHGVSSAMIDGTHDIGGGNAVNTLRSERGTPPFSTGWVDWRRGLVPVMA